MTSVIIAARGGWAAKTRLAGVLSLEARQALVAAMLDAMLRGLGPERCTVVSPTPALLELARIRGARPFAQVGGGLNAAFEAAYAGNRGAAVLLPGDLPLIRRSDLDTMLAALENVEVVLSPAFADEGTAAVAIAPAVKYRPVFGIDSFRRHWDQAERSGLSVTTVCRSGLGEDIDRPHDLARLARVAAANPDLADISALLTPWPILAQAV